MGPAITFCDTGPLPADAAAGVEADNGAAQAEVEGMRGIMNSIRAHEMAVYSDCKTAEELFLFSVPDVRSTSARVLFLVTRAVCNLCDVGCFVRATNLFVQPAAEVSSVSQRFCAAVYRPLLRLYRCPAAGL